MNEIKYVSAFGDRNWLNAFLFEQKSAHELVLEDAIYQHRNFIVGAFSIGYIRDIVKNKGIDVGLGAMATYNHNRLRLRRFTADKITADFRFLCAFDRRECCENTGKMSTDKHG